jgi:hypothetical protein
MEVAFHHCGSATVTLAVRCRRREFLGFDIGIDGQALS